MFVSDSTFCSLFTFLLQNAKLSRFSNQYKTAILIGQNQVASKLSFSFHSCDNIELLYIVT